MKHISLIAAAVAFASVTGTANAATYVITYTGTVGGSDFAGVFGTPSVLSGAFTSVYTFTVPKPGAYIYNSGTTSYIVGNSPATSPLSATLTINGITHSISGSWQGLVQYVDADGDPGIGYDYIYHRAMDNFDDYIINQVFRTGNLIDTLDYTQPLDITLLPSDGNNGYFRFTDASGILAGGDLYATRATVAILDSAVPEPSTWAIMLIGFGSIGLAMRRRQRQRADAGKAIR